jgi:tRNA (cmo5U34)-methyltransferase
VREPKLSVLPIERPPGPYRLSALPTEMRLLAGELARDFVLPGTSVYELGVSAAELLVELHSQLAPSIGFVGTDESEEALRRIRGQLDQVPTDRRIDLRQVDLNRGMVLREASVALLSFTSRTVHPRRRLALIEDVYRGLRAGGCALVMEPVRARNSLVNNLFGQQAREADQSLRGNTSRELSPPPETLAMACTLDEECQLLQAGGFRSIELFYKRHALCGFLALK